MKLNYDCVRDVLIALEDMTGPKDDFSFESIGLYDLASRLSEYDNKEIYYTIIKLNEAEYITTGWLGDNHNDYMYYMVYDITFKGHEYLNSVKSLKVWNAIKKGAIGLSMSLIPKLAESYVLSHLNFLK